MSFDWSAAVAAVAIGGGLLSVAMTNRATSRAAEQERAWNKRSDLYQELMTCLLRVGPALDLANQYHPAELLKWRDDFLALEPRLNAFASDAVLKRYGEFTERARVGTWEIERTAEEATRLRAEGREKDAALVELRHRVKTGDDFSGANLLIGAGVRDLVPALFDQLRAELRSNDTYTKR